VRPPRRRHSRAFAPDHAPLFVEAVAAGTGHGMSACVYGIFLGVRESYLSRDVLTPHAPLTPA